jgi:hypothetical protein
MITESEIITTLSGSFLGDYPSVISDMDARGIALDLFQKIFNVDVNGSIDSILFYEAINTNPAALAELHLLRLERGIENLKNLSEVVIPERTGQKLLFILDPENAPEIYSRDVLMRERQRLGEIFKLVANVPTVLSSNFIS